MGPKTQCTSPMHTPPTKTPPKTPPSALIPSPIGESMFMEPPPMPTPNLHPHPFVPKSPPKPRGPGGSPLKLICLGEAMIIAACAAIDATNGTTTRTDAFIEGMKPGQIGSMARSTAPKGPPARAPPRMTLYKAYPHALPKNATGAQDGPVPTRQPPNPTPMPAPQSTATDPTTPPRGSTCPGMTESAATASPPTPEPRYRTI